MAEIFGRAGRRMAERYQPQSTATFGAAPERLFPTWRHVLATGAGFLAVDPEPIGFSAAVIRDGVWFLSQLWVLPERQGEGVGSTLLDEALVWGRGAAAFSVVASPDPVAQALYLRRSMYPVWVQHELVGTAGGSMPPGMDPLAEGDACWVADLDRVARGVARPEDHRFFLEGARGLALRRDGGPAGYVYVWPGGRIGPGAAADARDVSLLVRAGLAAAAGTASLMIPSTNWGALAEVARTGFRLTSSSTFMASRRFPDGARYFSSGGALA